MKLPSFSSLQPPLVEGKEAFAFYQSDSPSFLLSLIPTEDRKLFLFLILYLYYVLNSFLKGIFEHLSCASLH